MVVEELIEVPASLIVFLGRVGLWLSAVGVIVVIWLIFQIVNFIINRKRMKEIYHIKKEMDKLDKKLDLLLKRK